MAWNACQKTPGFPAPRIRIFNKQPRGSLLAKLGNFKLEPAPDITLEFYFSWVFLSLGH